MNGIFKDLDKPPLENDSEQIEEQKERPRKHMAVRSQLSSIMSVSQGESSQEDSVDCNMDGVDEGRNENSVKYFDERRQNYSHVRFADIKGSSNLTGAEILVL